MLALRRRAARTLLAALALSPGVALAADPAPVPSARAYLLVDEATGEVLARRAPDRRLPMGSTTKMMTALLTLEGARPDRVLVVPRAATTVRQSSAGLVRGERIAVRYLLKGLLVASGNDAAITLARGLAPSQAAFVARMNARAAGLGLKNTHFANPHGLDAPGHYSSARDLISLARVAMRNATFRSIVANRYASIPGPNGVGRRRLTSENTLLTLDQDVDGVKTGQTAGAGYAMVAHARRANLGVGLYLAVIGEPSLGGRARDAKRLLDWGFAQYARPTVIAARTPVAQAAVRDQPGVRVPVGLPEAVIVPIRRDRPLVAVVTVPPEFTGPVAVGARVGEVVVRSGTRVVARRPLVALSGASEASVGDRVRAAVGRLVP